MPVQPAPDGMHGYEIVIAASEKFARCDLPGQGAQPSA
jgi:hypothetical protein